MPGTDIVRVARCLIFREDSAAARMRSRRLPVMVPACAAAMTPSRLPYWLSSFGAVFFPMPGMPGRLSLESPTRARMSGISFGGTPHFSTTSAARVTLFWRAPSISPTMTSISLLSCASSGSISGRCAL